MHSRAVLFHTADEFGTRQAPLVVRINKILSDYPPGSQILKVSGVANRANF